jgi:hypothetical protein
VELVPANGHIFFLENLWNIVSLAMLFSMYVNYMLYDCDVGEMQVEHKGRLHVRRPQRRSRHAI